MTTKYETLNIKIQDFFRLFVSYYTDYSSSEHGKGMVLHIASV